MYILFLFTHNRKMLATLSKRNPKELVMWTFSLTRDHIGKTSTVRVEPGDGTEASHGVTLDKPYHPHFQLTCTVPLKRGCPKPGPGSNRAYHETTHLPA
jgi:hypothetical protein